MEPRRNSALNENASTTWLLLAADFEKSLFPNSHLHSTCRRKVSSACSDMHMN